MKFYKILLLVTLSLFTSCNTTSKLWRPAYNENLRSFLINANQDIVLLGDKYNYVIDDHMHLLKDVLSSEVHRMTFINEKKTKIEVDRDNYIGGYIVIETFSNRMSRDDFLFLRSWGFSSQGAEAMSLHIPLRGVRYEMPSYLNAQQYYPLNRVYTIRVDSSSSSIGAVGKVVLTPFTLAADTILLIGKIIAAPFNWNDS